VIVGASGAEALVHERGNSASPVDLARAKVYEQLCWVKKRNQDKLIPFSYDLLLF